MRIILDIKYGSKFQETILKKTLNDHLNAIKSISERRHKKNKFDIQIEED